MEYYSSSEKRPQDYLKTVDLSNCEDMVAPMPLQKKVNVIKLSIREKGRVRDYFFECESESEMNKWVCSLAEVLGFMPGELHVRPRLSCRPVPSGLSSSLVCPVGLYRRV